MEKVITSVLIIVGALTIGVFSLFTLAGILAWIKEQWGIHVSKTLAVQRMTKQINDLRLENTRLKYELEEHKRLFGVSSAVKDKTND